MAWKWKLLNAAASARCQVAPANSCIRAEKVIIGNTFLLFVSCFLVKAMGFHFFECTLINVICIRSRLDVCRTLCVPLIRMTLWIGAAVICNIITITDKLWTTCVAKPGRRIEMRTNVEAIMRLMSLWTLEVLEKEVANRNGHITVVPWNNNGINDDIFRREKWTRILLKYACRTQNIYSIQYHITDRISSDKGHTRAPQFRRMKRPLEYVYISNEIMNSFPPFTHFVAIENVTQSVVSQKKKTKNSGARTQLNYARG